MGIPTLAQLIIFKMSLLRLSPHHLLLPKCSRREVLNHSPNLEFMSRIAMLHFYVVNS